MHPDVGIFNLQWYSVLMVLGLLSAIILFRVLCGVKKVKDASYNFYSMTGIVAIGVGLLSAILFQAVYDFIANPAAGFHITGMTFMGGLIGGVVTFVGGTWIFAKAPVKRDFYRVANLAAPCVVSAHMLGRVGCFMAGCCYGIPTDSFLGVLFPGDSHKVLPTQLFEAIFLAVLLAVMLILILKYNKVDFMLILYLYAYAVFRFIIEFFRGDERGSFIPGLSPSQMQSIVMLLAAVALTVLVCKFKIVPFCLKKVADGAAEVSKPCAPVDTNAAPDDSIKEGETILPTPSDENTPTKGPAALPKKSD